MKQLTAKHPSSGITIVERFLNGTRFMKITPSSLLPAIIEKLKQQFANRPVKIEQSKNGWIRIIKLERDEELERAVEKITGTAEIDEETILRQEALLLQKQGFVVNVEEVEWKKEEN